MKKGGIIDESFSYRAILKLRSASAVFLPLYPSEVLYHLRNAPIDGQQVIETPSLATIRVSFSKSLILEDKINLLESADEISSMAHGEFIWVSQSIQLVGDVLQQIWQEKTLSLAHKSAWSAWTWKSLRVEQLNCLPVHNPSERSRRDIFIMTICKIIVSAIVMYNDRETRIEYLKWVASNILEQRFNFDPEFEKEIPKALKHQLLSLDETNEPGDEEAAHHKRYFLVQLIEDLPEILKSKLFSDHKFTSSLGIQTAPVISIQGLSFDAKKFWDCIQITLESGKASILSTDDISKLYFDYVDGTEECDYPLIMLSGCYDGQIGSPSMLLLAKDVEPKSFAAQAIQKGWIDYPLPEGESRIEKTALLEYHFQRAREFELMIENSAPHFYSNLRNSISSGNETPLDCLIPSNNEMIARLLRIRPTRDAFDELLSDSAQELLAQYGPTETFNRLSFLPVQIPKCVTSNLLEANKNGTIDLCKFLVLRSNGIISAFHRLKLLLEVRDELKIENSVITTYIGEILEEWSAKATAFLEILNWSERLLTSFKDASEYRADLLLANIWTHAGNIFEIVFQDRKYSFAPRIEFFAAQQHQNLENYLTSNATLGFFAECVEGLSQEYLLLQGLNYAIEKDEDIHLVEEENHSIITSILEKNSEKITPIFVIDARERAPKRLGSMFSVSALDIIKRFSLRFPILANETTTIDEVAEFALIKTLEAETQGFGWLLLGYCGVKWLPDDQLNQAQRSIKEFDILTMLNKNRSVCIRAAQELMRWPFRNGSQETQEVIEQMIISCAKSFGQTYNGSGYGTHETNRKRDLELLLQFTLWTSKSPEIRDSWEIFCRTVRQIVNAWPDSGVFWRSVIEQFLGGTRFEISKPLWKLFNKLRCDVSY
jgi:hypothetical protein